MPVMTRTQTRFQLARRAFVAALALTAAAALPARAQTPDPKDYRLIVRVPREEVDSWLKDQIAKSGGKLDQERYHFVVGFSTGHYGSDPVQAIAMRRLAFSLLNNTFAAGDRVTPVAWELQLWDKGEPIDLTADPKSRAAFVDAVPYAPAEGSLGGHDTERALYDTLTQAVPRGEASSTIVLLLTNTNQSQGPTGKRVTLFGANNRQLAEAIASRGYRPRARHTFTAQSTTGDVNIDVTALFPKELKPLPGAASGARYPTFPVNTWQPAADRPGTSDALPNPVSTAGSSAPTGETPGTAPANPDQPENKGGFPWPLLLLALLVIAGIAALLLRKKPDQEPKPAAVPQGKPVPGSIHATLGSAPNSKNVTLSPLTTASRWILLLDPTNRPVVTEDEKAEGTRLARITIDDRRRLVLEGETDVLFQNVAGIKADAANPRQLLLAPGDHL
ncbi:MAG: hypothetical protein K0Q72_3622, partial [Armatimonadetes bacterium]|nr:hypothetical protein [Armatimonadota bacterium]